MRHKPQPLLKIELYLQCHFWKILMHQSQFVHLNNKKAIRLIKLKEIYAFCYFLGFTPLFPELFDPELRLPLLLVELPLELEL